ncbi:Guanylate kinase, sub-group [Penicillium griseofulvum]|uniref:guanylate kinase n=1 Tax=Penicillium patulum TaxID=5078 RepID=A0A135LHN5_PENPA|nr:Guanylate kinase, sub-group [Penicillium griseofulvum]KXG48438.1 Guanylate kinase, sub-group [Penicillium griseofulvum]
MAPCTSLVSTSTPLILTPTAPQDRRPIVISGPSGAGKGTLIQKLIDAHPNTFELTVSHTTRKPRPGETDGISYHFVSVETYNTLKSNGDLIEDAMYADNFYGTSKAALEKIFNRRLIPILDIDMVGVQQVTINPKFKARYVFIKPRDLAVLEQRLRGRGTESELHIQARLNQARRELEFAETTGVFDRVIVNDDLEKAYLELEGFVFGLE